MLSLVDPIDKLLHPQVAEVVSMIPGNDFPGRRYGLVKELFNTLNPSPESYAINLSILEMACSIFGRWRSEMRYNELFTTINLVLSEYVDPFLQFLRCTTGVFLVSPLPAKYNAQTIVQSVDRSPAQFNLLCSCVRIYLSLSKTHIPSFSMQKAGRLSVFFVWDPPELQTYPDEPTLRVPSQMKTAVLELAEAFTQRYPNLLTSSSSLESFLGGGERSRIAYGGLVRQSLRFLSTAICSGNYRGNFESLVTIDGLIEDVLAPNMILQNHEVESLEDDPLECVRLDLSFANSILASDVGGADC